VFEALSDELELHFLRAPRPAASAVRGRTTLRSVRSKRVRSPRERERLRARGDRAAVYSLQGDLAFSGIEVAIRRIVGEEESVTRFVLDLTRAVDVDPPASRLLLELLRELGAHGRTVAFVGMKRHARLQRFLAEAQAADPELRLLDFDDLDSALEWCEERLLEEDGGAGPEAEEVPLARHEYLQGFDADGLSRVAALLERRAYAARELVVRQDDPADSVYLLVKGRLSVVVELPDGRLQRLSTLSPGMGVGEPALVAGTRGTASVRADEPSTCWVLPAAAYRALAAEDPTLQTQLLENLLRTTIRIVRQMNAETIEELL